MEEKEIRPDIDSMIEKAMESLGFRPIVLYKGKNYYPAQLSYSINESDNTIVDAVIKFTNNKPEKDDSDLETEGEHHSPISCSKSPVLLLLSVVTTNTLRLPVSSHLCSAHTKAIAVFPAPHPATIICLPSANCVTACF